MHRATVGSYGGCVSYERGTPLGRSLVLLGGIVSSDQLPHFLHSFGHCRQTMHRALAAGVQGSNKVPMRARI